MSCPRSKRDFPKQKIPTSTFRGGLFFVCADLLNLMTLAVRRLFFYDKGGHSLRRRIPPLFALSSAGQSTPVLRRDRFCMCKSGRKTHEGPRPLNPAIESLTIGRLHALRKGVRAASCCGFRFGLLLAAAAALRRGFGHFLAGG